MVVSQNHENLHMRYYFLLLFSAPGALNRNLPHSPPLRNSFIASFDKFNGIYICRKIPYNLKELSCCFFTAFWHNDQKKEQRNDDHDKGCIKRQALPIKLSDDTRPHIRKQKRNRIDQVIYCKSRTT